MLGAGLFVRGAICPQCSKVMRASNTERRAPVKTSDQQPKLLLAAELLAGSGITGLPPAWLLESTVS